MPKLEIPDGVKKIIFLDVDGVLHPAFRSTNFFEKSCMDCLRRITEETGAHIVLTSNWRKARAARERVDKELAKVGATRVACTGNLGASGAAIRIREIIQWLQRSKFSGEWVIMDDMDFLDTEAVPGRLQEKVRTRFLKTDRRTGLVEEHVQLAIEILGTRTASDMLDLDTSEEGPILGSKPKRPSAQARTLQFTRNVLGLSRRSRGDWNEYSTRTVPDMHSRSAPPVQATAATV